MNIESFLHALGRSLKFDVFAALHFISDLFQTFQVLQFNT
jgi:hypothetical protein